jgi:hypothetical protein
MSKIGSFKFDDFSPFEIQPKGFILPPLSRFRVTPMATSVSLGITHGLECPEFHEFQKYFDICWQRIPTHQVEAGTFPTPLIARLIALQNWHEGDNQCRGGLKVAGQRDLTRRRSIQIPYDSVECRSAFRPEQGSRFPDSAQ